MNNDTQDFDVCDDIDDWPPGLDAEQRAQYDRVIEAILGPSLDSKRTSRRRRSVGKNMNDETTPRPALWRRIVAGFLFALARVMRALRRDRTAGTGRTEDEVTVDDTPTGDIPSDVRPVLNLIAHCDNVGSEHLLGQHFRDVGNRLRHFAKKDDRLTIDLVLPSDDGLFVRFWRPAVAVTISGTVADRAVVVRRIDDRHDLGSDLRLTRRQRGEWEVVR